MLEEAMREVKQLKALTAEQDNAIKEQNEKLIKNESERRLLHNTIQELKVCTISIYANPCMIRGSFTQV